MKKSILINSRDRMRGTSSNFEIKYDLRQFYKCDYYYVSSVVIQSSFYVVNSSNNQLIFNHPSVGGATTTITIASGNYSASELVSAIQTALEAISAGLWTVSYSSVTGKFSFSTGATSFGFDARPTNSILSQLMGYSAQLYASTTATKTSANVADLTGPKYLHIKSNALSFKEGFEPMAVNQNMKNIIVSVPIDVNNFETIVYKNYNDLNNRRNFDKHFPNLIDISLVDENGNELNLNGTEWQFEIMAYFSDIYFK